MDYLHGSNFLSTIDLASGFWQLKIREQDSRKTSFSSHIGHYEWTRVGFGLANGPAVFQRLMTNVLRKGLGKFLMIFLEDVVCYSKTFEEHIQHLSLIFQWIREAGLVIPYKKCFRQKTSQVLGICHLIKRHGGRSG